MGSLKDIDIPKLGFQLFAERGDIKRVMELLDPVIEDGKAILPELIPLLSRIANALGVTFQTEGVLASYDVYSLQRDLNKLGYDLAVDGDVGPDGSHTRTAVLDFQIKNHMALQDGIPGISTCARVKSEADRLG